MRAHNSVLVMIMGVEIGVGASKMTLPVTGGGGDEII